MFPKPTSRWAFDKDRLRLKNQSKIIQLDPDTRFLIGSDGKSAPENAIKRELVCARDVIKQIILLINHLNHQDNTDMEELMSRHDYDMLALFDSNKTFPFDLYL